jgi:hypothetical protein
MFIPDPESRIKKIPDPGTGSASKNLSIFNPKNCFYALGNMIPAGYSSRIWILIFLPIPDPRVKKTPDPGSATLTVGYLYCSNLKSCFFHPRRRRNHLRNIINSH